MLGKITYRGRTSFYCLSNTININKERDKLQTLGRSHLRETSVLVTESTSWGVGVTYRFTDCVCSGGFDRQLTSLCVFWCLYVEGNVNNNTWENQSPVVNIKPFISIGSTVREPSNRGGQCFYLPLSIGYSPILLPDLHFFEETDRVRDWVCTGSCLVNWRRTEQKWHTFYLGYCYVRRRKGDSL